MALGALLLLIQLYHDTVSIPEAGVNVPSPRGWTRGVHASFPELRGVFLSPEGATISVVAGRKKVRKVRPWLRRLRLYFQKRECRRGRLHVSTTPAGMELTCRKKGSVVSLTAGVISSVPVMVAFRCSDEGGAPVCDKPLREYRSFVSSLFGRALPARTPRPVNR